MSSSVLCILAWMALLHAKYASTTDHSGSTSCWASSCEKIKRQKRLKHAKISVRSASAIVHQIDVSLEEASISLGRSPLQSFLRVVVPLMLGGILSGVVLTWVTVASELSATVVLYSGQWRTMTVVMFQALEGGGAGIATAAASTLIVLTLIPVALLYRLLRRYELG